MTKGLQKGDACFSASYGETCIGIKTDKLLHTIHRETYTLDGRKSPHDRHPTLFISREALIKYWQDERNK